jgi:hypothetical protein
VTVQIVACRTVTWPVRLGTKRRDVATIEGAGLRDPQWGKKRDKRYLPDEVVVRSAVRRGTFALHDVTLSGYWYHPDGTRGTRRTYDRWDAKNLPLDEAERWLRRRTWRHKKMPDWLWNIVVELLRHEGQP